MKPECGDVQRCPCTPLHPAGTRGELGLHVGQGPLWTPDLSSRMARAMRALLPTPGTQMRGGVGHGLGVSCGTHGGGARLWVGPAGITSAPSCPQRDGLGGHRGTAVPSRPLSALAERAHWPAGMLAPCPAMAPGSPTGPTGCPAGHLRAQPASLDTWAGQGPAHRAPLPVVCNFMSHERCLKHVKTPCTGLAPSLVQVRMECGPGLGQRGPQGSS